MEILTALARGLAHMMATVPATHLPLEQFCRTDDGDQTCIIAEMATTQGEKSHGLMYRDYLPEGYGMLFIRDDEQPRRFWMRNTIIPLDMYFLDTEKTVADQTTMTPCLYDPCPTYTSRAPAQYVVEMMAD